MSGTNNTSTTNTAMVIFLIALALMLIGGLVVMPAIQEAEANYAGLFLFFLVPQQ